MLRVGNLALLQSFGCGWFCVALQMCQSAVAEIFKNAKRGYFLSFFLGQSSGCYKVLGQY